MAQKPMLRVEVYARALRASQIRKEDSVQRARSQQVTKSPATTTNHGSQITDRPLQEGWKDPFFVSLVLSAMAMKYFGGHPRTVNFGHSGSALRGPRQKSRSSRISHNA